MTLEEAREQLRKYLRGEWADPQKPALVERWEVGLDAAYEELALTRPLLDLRKLKLLADKHPQAQGVLGKREKPVPSDELYILFRGVKGRFPHNAVAVATEASLLVDVSLPRPQRKELFLLVPEALVEKPLGKEEKHLGRAREKLTRPYP